MRSSQTPISEPVKIPLLGSDPVDSNCLVSFSEKRRVYQHRIIFPDVIGTTSCASFVDADITKSERNHTYFGKSWIQDCMTNITCIFRYSSQIECVNMRNWFLLLILVGNWSDIKFACDSFLIGAMQPPSQIIYTHSSRLPALALYLDPNHSQIQSGGSCVLTQARSNHKELRDDSDWETLDSDEEINQLDCGESSTSSK